MLHKRLLLVACSFAVLALAVAACAPAASPAPTAAPPTAAPAQPTAAPVATTAPAQPTAAPAQPTTAPAQATTAPAPSGNLVPIKVGWVSSMDQIGLPVALEQGFFEKQGLDVKLAGPFPTGVDALNALQAGDAQFVQVGVPAIGAILKGMDLVFVGNYTGSSVVKGIDETMAMIARDGSGIDPKDLKTLKGKKIGASVGSISQLYLLGVMKQVGLATTDVTVVNTPPADMPVALQTGGVDAIVIWDPFPEIALNDVKGSFQVMRGGGYISFIGYQVALRDWAKNNPDTVVKYLTARAQADQWMRQNPDKAAEIATRYISGLSATASQQAMQFNVKQLDPRFSACNYLAFDNDQKLLLDIKAVNGTIDPSKTFEPTYILKALQAQPGLVTDLAPIPDGAQVAPGYTFDATKAAAACK
ncbi:MAG: NrtA/SsuA/CpmA family ABC transporter substrate-binding protein [Chloroflexi bacterium]|nr:NrtA/SsuA/CpmA family ABC transporter substrate-binding protein [Chloroflexota bacterium]